MTRRFFLIAAVLVAFMSSCKDDDNGPKLISQQERNTLDDAAIVHLLENAYFLDNGTFDIIDESEIGSEEIPRLIDYATQSEEGYWIVKKPNHPANGNKIQSNYQDSILIQYTLSSFTSGKDASDMPTTGLIVETTSTINQTGFPKWDPSFYYAKPIIDKNLAENPEYGFTREAFEIEGIIEGLKEFESSNKAYNEDPIVDYQGLIIVPSRLAYGRNANQYSTQYARFFDKSMILNFELYKVIDRGNL